MKDIVTFETAVRLREAGFPQPFPTAGMFGYNDKGYLFVRTHDGSVDNNRYGSVLLNGGNDNVSLSKSDFKFVVFAPTATDILRELDGLFLIRKSMYESKPIFSVFDEKRAENGLNVALSIDYNPAEAAAEAWLKLKDEL